MKTLGCIVIMLLACAVPAQAAQVYSGCAVPAPTPRHVWYIDPVHGKTPAAGGNGSQASPWNSLSGVISGQWGLVGFSVPGYARPLLSSVPYVHIANGKFTAVADQLGNPPVQPGDAIMLMSGNYGDIALGDFDLPTTNSDFVTVEAAPGQVPVFSTLAIDRTNKWVFNAIKVQSLLGRERQLPAPRLPDGSGRSVSHLRHHPAEHADQLSGQHGWLDPGPMAVRRRATGVWELGSAGNGANGEPYTSCISISGSHIQNVRTGALLAANNSLFSDNVIDHFGDDGIDYAASNIAITHNTIHDNLDIGDGNHEDAMQGQNGPLGAGVVYNAFSNILIDSNLIVRQTVPNNPFPHLSAGDRRL